MSEFGHFGAVIPGVGCIDSWGAGPFLIEAAGKLYRFEDSDRFGPALLRNNGEMRANPYPGERSPFWLAHTCWVRQGRRVADDGVTCVWDQPAPTVVEKRGRHYFVVDHGDEDGAIIIANPLPTPEAPQPKERR